MPNRSLAGDYQRFCTYLQNERFAEPSTLDHYRRWLARWAAYLDGRSPWEATEEDVSGWLADLRTHGYSRWTIAQVVSVMRAFYDWGVAREKARRSVWSVVRRPPVPQRLPRVLTQQQVKAIIERAREDRTPVGFRDRAMLEVLYATGCRVSELVALDVEDVEFGDAEATVYLHEQKTRRDRPTPIYPGAAEALRLYIHRGRFAFNWNASRALFLSDRGRRINRHTVGDILKRLAKQAGVEARITPHGLRHAFCTHLYEEGADILAVSKLVGHAKVQTTTIYTQVAGAALRKEYVRFHPLAGRAR
ncbi:MAG TPA: tyrosine-type recombinase/integrase [Acidobacteriaceae bacterium]|nr:tyrosine-type recombinase/integrase [Acidobacteriaceae bacterium]